jgi:RNA polymerase sigma factor (sigma-70 family)
MNPNNLVLEHLHHVEHIAKKHIRRMPPSTSLDELISDGYLGLVGVAQRFDPKRGNKFLTFAGPRIIGAIFDGCRERYKHYSHLANDPEIELEANADAPSLEPEGIAIRNSVCAEVQKALAALPKLEREVAILCDIEGYSQSQVGKRYGKSKAWAYLVHRRAREMLRKRLEPLRNCI